MGSFFRLPFLVNQDLRNCLKTLRSKGYRVWAAVVRGGPSFWEVDLSPPTAVLFGQEAAGLPKDLMGAVDGLFTIPMTPNIDSLNVAMAAGLVIYEAYRQKKSSEF